MYDTRLLFFILMLAITSSCNKEDARTTMNPTDTESTTDVMITGTLSKTITHEGQSRSYILFVPEDYDGSEDVPLILNYHGYTSNADEQMHYGDFREIAEREGIIVAHPERLKLSGNTHWNVGGWTLGSTADDIGFTESMIQEISEDYNIDSNRIYSTGMSNGGFFSFELACKLSHKIAAIASVTGSMTPETFDACDPSRAVPILQFHGTQDGVVPYVGTTWSKHIGEVLEYWITANDLDKTSTITQLEDINESDGSTLERLQYGDEIDAATVIHYKVIGGAHTWPGSAITKVGTNYDVDASEVIWTFFNTYDLKGRREL